MADPMRFRHHRIPIRFHRKNEPDDPRVRKGRRAPFEREPSALSEGSSVEGRAGVRRRARN
eukprot:scaffold350_cov333-Pavlova_lutheri.AAC.56